MALEEMTLQQLKDRFEGDLNTRFTDAYLQIKLEEAIALISGECPTADLRRESGALPEITYKRIVADTVFGVTRNPGGFANESEGGVSYGLRASVASGEMWLSDRDIETLTGVAKKTPKFGTASIGVDNGWGV